MVNDPVKDFQVLKSKPKSDDALELLKRLASQVKPILIQHNWTIRNLCEFFPANPNLLGVNINRGWKIKLRLRPAHDQSQFLNNEDILATLLHEITHIVHGPHDEKFYKLLNQLKRETEDLIASGYRGEGFYSTGHRLSSARVVAPRYLNNEIIAKAAEKRLQMSRLMLPFGGVQLGGIRSINNPILPPVRAAASAAEKRLQDQIWCGGSIQEFVPPVSAATSSGKSTGNDQAFVKKNTSESLCDRLNNMEGKRKAKADNELPAKRSRVTIVIDLTIDEATVDVAVQETTRKEEGLWTCPTCTYLNQALVLVCEMCLREKPSTSDLPLIPSDAIYNEDNVWICPQCTLKNESKWLTCIACSCVYLR
ncbi:WLM domain-containing protein [Mycotypha africana]|uniref:WLM domain-containing protein n=1 Tax=Mycotypha africana TaxID=64632 RepID=UPI0022FFEFB9|nr:WLM domain-containing protein [Mycotypha africana]KAI8975766.1 WLM domain-containing protein [Mycotypha africana]